MFQLYIYKQTITKLKYKVKGKVSPAITPPNKTNKQETNNSTKQKHFSRTLQPYVS